MADEEKNETTEETPEEAPAEEAPEAAASDDAPVEDTPPEERESGGDDDEEIDWKTRKRLERSRESGAAGPERSPEERSGERAQRRGAAAKSRSAYRRKRREGGEKAEGTPPAEQVSAGRKERQGRVISDRADKTIRVQIDQARRHPAYEKIVRGSSTLHVHDERNEANEGDLVRVVESRPISRRKRWRLVEVLEKAK